MPDPGSLAPLADRWPFALGLAVLTVATVGLQRWAGVGLTRPTVVSILRATAQLAIVAVALSGILAVPWTVALFLLLMVSTASWTSARRLHELHRGRLAALLGVLATVPLSAGSAQTRDGAPGNPPGTAVGRAVDRARGRREAD